MIKTLRFPTSKSHCKIDSTRWTFTLYTASIRLATKAKTAGNLVELPGLQYLQRQHKTVLPSFCSTVFGFSFRVIFQFGMCIRRIKTRSHRTLGIASRVDALWRSSKLVNALKNQTNLISTRRYVTRRVRCERSLSLTIVWFNASKRVDALGVNRALD